MSMPTQRISRRWNSYLSYKVSGVEWLDKIPEHWHTLPFRHIFSVIYRYPTYYDIKYVETGVPEIRGEALTNNGNIIQLSDQRYISETTNQMFPRTILLENDLVMSVRGTMGKIGLVNHFFVGSNITANLLRLSPNHDQVYSPFLVKLLISDYFQQKLDQTSSQTTIKTVTIPQLAQIPLPLPPIDEQRAIAVFLDRETALIDALIERKERLIELLQERRAALISQAVTKGLDPNMPMKESGVEWIGKIPSHWEVTRIKYLTTFITSGSRGWAEYYSDTGAIFIRIGNLSKASLHLDLQDIQNVTPPLGAEGARTRIAKNDVLISITANIGSIGVVTEDIGEAYVNQHIALVRPETSTGSPLWIGYCLLSKVGQEQFKLTLQGGTKDGLTLSDVANLFLLIPSKNEQIAIVEFIDNQGNKIESLIGHVERAIDTLREYRTALISAAVTGKIDVRDD